MGNNGIRIHFGMYQDGAEWSEQASALGELRVGPMGMVSFLESRLGLRGVEAHQAIRIDQYMQRVANADSPRAWFHRSFVADPWSTAKQLLTWRDELVEAGWNGDTICSDSRRLQAISNIERQNLPLAPGFADRMRQVMECLWRLEPNSIASITLEEPLSCLPKGWWKLFANLIGTGLNFSDNHIQKTFSPSLDSVQSVLSFLKRSLPVQSYDFPGESPDEIPLAEENGAGSLPPSDNSFFMVEADTEWEAAEALALWLSSQPDSNTGTTIILSRPSIALEQAFSSHGLPKLGGSAVSRWRAHLQILPLMLANAWKPADYGALVELLALPASPVPSFARRYLLDALAKEAGIGGEAWDQAMARIEERSRELRADKEKGEAEAAKLIEKLERMLVKDRYHPVDGIPEEKLRERCQWIIESLGPRIPDEPILAEALRQAEDMERLARGKGNIPRVALERMVDSIIGLGGIAPGNVREASPWRVVPHPGAVAYQCNTLIWWDFTAADIAAPTFWSATELDDLVRHHCIMLNEPGLARRCESVAWRNALAKTSDRILLFRPRSVRGEETERHPFWDEIATAIERNDLSRTAESFVLDGKRLVTGGKWRLAGREVTMTEVVKEAIPVGQVTVTIPPGIVPVSEKTSYSDMKDLIECPMKWVLRKPAGLYLSSAISRPGAAQSMGNLCHRIARTIFIDSGRKWKPEEARLEAETLYCAYAEAMLLDMLADGREVEYARGKKQVGDAFHSLAGLLAKYGLEPEAAETDFSCPMGNSMLHGVVDLLCRDSNGNRFILDFKWTGTPGRYRDEVRAGEAMQLACYVHLISASHPGMGVDAGYFLLQQRRLFSDCSRLGSDRLPASRSLRTVFDMAERSWREEVKRLADGVVLVRALAERLACEMRGLTEKGCSTALKAEAGDKGLLYLSPSCRICDYGGLCDSDSLPDFVGDEKEGGQ